MSKKRQKIVHLLIIVLLVIPLILMIICFVDWLYDGVVTVPGSVTIFCGIESLTIFIFIISSYSLLIVAAVFAQKYTFNKSVKEKVSQIVDVSINNNLELLRIEAHECIMTAYLLIEHKEYNWALAWTLRSLKLNIKLYAQNPYFCNEFISCDFTGNLKIIERQLNCGQENIDRRDDKKFISIRKWKDFFECMVYFKELEERIIDFDDDYYNSINVIKDVLNYSLTIIRAQIKALENSKEDKNIDYIKEGIRVLDDNLYKRFKEFVINPDTVKNINYFIN